MKQILSLLPDACQTSPGFNRRARRERREESRPPLSLAAIISLAFILMILLPPAATLAQEEQQEGNDEQPPAEVEPAAPRLHLVQPGETLTSIANLYGTTVEILQRLNNISDPSLLYAGQELIIPGGDEGDRIMTLYTVQVGDSLPALADAFQSSVAEIAATNRLVNPYQLIAGQSLAIVSQTGQEEPERPAGTPHLTLPGETASMIAVRYGLTRRELAEANGLDYPPRLFPGQRLRIPGDRPFYDLPGNWALIEARPLPAVQGETVAIYVERQLNTPPAGRFGDQPLHFAPHGDGYAALVGLDAFTEPGLYRLALADAGSEGGVSFQQLVSVVAGNYGSQVLVVPAEIRPLLAPEIRQEENLFLETIFANFTPEQYWQGVFREPVTNTVVTAGYGIARSYNGGPFDVFHTGIDYAAPLGTPIVAPAAGQIVFNDYLELRGNVLIIDHGLGVMTGYFHLSAAHVDAGDWVEAGQHIADIGSTGLSTGPHLHWDVRIMNVPVNGRQWLRETFP